MNQEWSLAAVFFRCAQITLNHVRRDLRGWLFFIMTLHLNYMYVSSTCTFGCWARRVSLISCGITSRWLAAFITSLCQSKEVSITWLAWYVSSGTTHLVGEAVACCVGQSLHFSLRFTIFLGEMFWCTAWDRIYFHIDMDTFIHIHICNYLHIHIYRCNCFTYIYTYIYVYIYNSTTLCIYISIHINCWLYIYYIYIFTFAIALTFKFTCSFAPHLAYIYIYIYIYNQFTFIFCIYIIYNYIFIYFISLTFRSFIFIFSFDLHLHLAFTLLTNTFKLNFTEIYIHIWGIDHCDPITLSPRDIRVYEHCQQQLVQPHCHWSLLWYTRGLILTDACAEPVFASLPWQSFWWRVSHCWCQQRVLHVRFHLHKLWDHCATLSAVAMTTGRFVCERHVRHVFWSFFSSFCGQLTLHQQRSSCEVFQTFSSLLWDRQAWRCKHFQLVRCGEMNIFCSCPSSLAVQTLRDWMVEVHSSTFWDQITLHLQSSLYSWCSVSCSPIYTTNCPGIFPIGLRCLVHHHRHLVVLPLSWRAWGLVAAWQPSSQEYTRP